MRFKAWAQTDVGLKRDVNQDAILVDHKINLYIVADGMGGHKGGEVASALAVETAQKYLSDNRFDQGVPPRNVLVNAYREASGRIHHKSTHESPDLMGMGTTMVLMWERQGQCFFANVGDSRAYLFRDGRLWQMTEDHSLINEQVRAGVISEEEAPHVVGRNVITRSVGFERDVSPDVLERQGDPEDLYMLCSDGLSGLVPAPRLQDLFRRYPPEELAEKLVKEAKANGGDDNISVILVRQQS